MASKTKQTDKVPRVIPIWNPLSDTLMGPEGVWSETRYGSFVDVFETISSEDANRAPLANQCIHTCYPAHVPEFYVDVPETGITLNTKTVEGRSGAIYRSVVSYTEHILEPKRIYVRPQRVEVRTSADLNRERYVNTFTEMMGGGGPSAAATVFKAAMEMKDLTTIKDDVIGFLKFTRNLAKGNLSLREAAGEYLFYTYGVKPTVSSVSSLLSDIRQMTLSVRTAVEKLQQRFRSAKTEYVRDQRDLFSHDGPDAYVTGGIPQDLLIPRYSRDHTRVWDNGSWLQDPHWVTAANLAAASCRMLYSKPYAVAKLFCLWKASDLRSYSPTIAEIALNSSKLFETAWELVPLSFILNWFIDVGGVMKRVQNIWESFLCEISPVQGIWESLEQQFWYSYIPYSITLSRSPTYELIPVDTDGITYNKLSVTYGFRIKPITGPVAMTKTNGKLYKRNPTFLSTMDVLWPTFSVDLNFSKVLSILAIAGG